MGITKLQHTSVTEAPHSMHELQSTAQQTTSFRVKVSSDMICPHSIATAVARLQTLVRVGHGRLQEWDCVVVSWPYEQGIPRTLMLSLASCLSCLLQGATWSRTRQARLCTYPDTSP